VQRGERPERVFAPARHRKLGERHRLGREQDVGLLGDDHLPERRRKQLAAVEFAAL
jgi:hypothetical protein